MDKYDDTEFFMHSKGKPGTVPSFHPTLNSHGTQPRMPPVSLFAAKGTVTCASWARSFDCVSFFAKESKEPDTCIVSKYKKGEGLIEASLLLS